MDLFFVEQVLVILSNDMLRSCPQKIAVVPRSGSRTIRDGMLQKGLGWGLSESVLRDFKRNCIVRNNRIYKQSLLVHNPLRGTTAIFCGQDRISKLKIFHILIEQKVCFKKI